MTMYKAMLEEGQFFIHDGKKIIASAEVSSDIDLEFSILKLHSENGEDLTYLDCIFFGNNIIGRVEKGTFFGNCVEEDAKDEAYSFDMDDDRSLYSDDISDLGYVPDDDDY